MVESKRSTGIQWRYAVAGVVMLAFLAPTPVAASQPVPMTPHVELVCPNGRAPRAGVCPPPGDPFTIGGGPASGGGGDGGLLGAIGRVLGGLTGGIL